MRREAGQWVRARLLGSVQAMLAIRSGIAGLALGVGLTGMMGWPAAIALVAVLAALEALRMRRYARDRFSRLLKGTVAERFVGGLTEGAIAAPGCAVAHSVTKIADVGDIDHLVATPGTLWVVETKYRKVPNSRLRRCSVGSRSMWQRFDVGLRRESRFVVAWCSPRQKNNRTSICTRMGAWKFSIPDRWLARSIAHLRARQTKRIYCSRGVCPRWPAKSLYGERREAQAIDTKTTDCHYCPANKGHRSPDSSERRCFSNALTGRARPTAQAGLVLSDKTSSRSIEISPLCFVHVPDEA